MAPPDSALPLHRHLQRSSSWWRKADAHLRCCTAGERRSEAMQRLRVREMEEEDVARRHTAAREAREAEYSCERAVVAAWTAAVVEEGMVVLAAAEYEQSACMGE